MVLIVARLDINFSVVLLHYFSYFVLIVARLDINDITADEIFFG